MAKITYLDLTEETKKKYFESIQPADRFTNVSVRVKKLLFSRRRKKGIKKRSLLPQIAELWHALTDEQREAWSEAGAARGLNGWRAFVADTTYRILNDLSGTAEPSIYHQDMVGELRITDPAYRIKITQLHPRNYYIKKKKKGTKSQYDPVLITEDITFPFSIGLNYKSELEPNGFGSYYGTAKYGVVNTGDIVSEYARMYALIWYSYQGRNREAMLKIDLDYQSDWQTAYTTLTDILGYVVGYDLYFDINWLQGSLFFDNVKVEHDGYNWVRDPYCKDIRHAFTRAYYQIPRRWVGLELPNGAGFESTYPIT